MHDAVRNLGFKPGTLKNSPFQFSFSLHTFRRNEKTATVLHLPAFSLFMTEARMVWTRHRGLFCTLYLDPQLSYSSPWTLVLLYVRMMVSVLLPTRT